MAKEIGRSPLRGSGHSPDGGAASSTASPAKPSVPNARPTRYDDAIIRAAAEKLAVDCAEWDGKAEDWVDDLIKCKYHWDDGYTLARALEERCYLSADFQLAEILDGGSSYLWDAERDAVKAWVVANAITPTLAVGTRVTSRRGSGTIREIRETEAQYIVLPDDDAERFAKGGGYVLSYDDVTPEQVSA